MRNIFRKTHDLSLVNRFLRAFTLFEILIVIVLMTMVVSFGGFQISKLMREQRFKGEVDAVISRLQAVQAAMLLLNADITVKLTVAEDKNALVLTPVMDGDKSPVAPLRLRTIQFMEFDDGKPQESGLIALKFYSKGFEMSRGVLRLSTSSSGDLQGALERYIVFPGYPTFFQTFVEKPSIPKPFFNEPLTRSTLLQIEVKKESEKSEEKDEKEKPKGAEKNAEAKE